MTALMPLSVTAPEAFALALINTTDSQVRRLEFSSTTQSIKFLYQSFRIPPEHRITIGLKASHANLYLAIELGRQVASWYCGRQGCSGPSCQHFTEANVLEQAQKMVWALAAYGPELPWNDVRHAGAHAVSVAERPRLERELSEVSALPRHVPQLLGEALVGLVDLIECARDNDMVLHKRMGERARIKTLFEALPAGTLLICNDGSLTGTMTNERGRTTLRSIDITSLASGRTRREDVRLEIRDRFRLLTAERVCAIPDDLISSHQRLELISKATPLSARFAEIA